MSFSLRDLKAIVLAKKKLFHSQKRSQKISGLRQAKATNFVTPKCDFRINKKNIAKAAVSCEFAENFPST